MIVDTIKGAAARDTPQNLGNREFGRNFIDHNCNSLKVRFHKIHIPDSSQQVPTSPEKLPTTPDNSQQTPDNSQQLRARCFRPASVMMSNN